jgi:hypothetical protein
MVLEDQQKAIHTTMSTKSAMDGMDPRDAQGKAEAACRDIDASAEYLMRSFRRKYPCKDNPIRDERKDWGKEKGFGGRGAVEFVTKVRLLIMKHSKYTPTIGEQRADPWNS